MKLYKAVRPDGRDFFSGTVQWAPKKTKARKGRVVKHPTSEKALVDDFGDPAFETFLSVSTDPTNLPGAQWPMRLLEVEPVGELVEVSEFKRGGTAFRVAAEIDPSIRFGPQGCHVVALIDRIKSLTTDETPRLGAARGAAGDAAWYAARGAAGYAAGYAARDAAWDAAWDAAGYAAGYAAWSAAGYAARYAAWDAARYAARALAVRDLVGWNGFTQAHYDTLTGPWAEVVGKVHPDDADRLVR